MHDTKDILCRNSNYYRDPPPEFSHLKGIENTALKLNTEFPNET